MPQKFIIAIDGPAGSGKSTSAKLAAERLGYLYIDTGAMYRAVTYLALKSNVLNNNEDIIELARSTDIKLQFVNGITRVWVDNTEITDYIRSMEVNSNVSDVSKIEEVRHILVQKQREMAKHAPGVVMEGRDIGTVVFPDADIKFFLTATLDERAIRRAREYETAGKIIPVEEIKKSLVQRDIIDTTREISPLVKSPDAIEIDTSRFTIEEQVNLILEKVLETANKKGIKILLQEKS